MCSTDFGEVTLSFVASIISKLYCGSSDIFRDSYYGSECRTVFVEVDQNRERFTYNLVCIETDLVRLKGVELDRNTDLDGVLSMTLLGNGLKKKQRYS